MNLATEIENVCLCAYKPEGHELGETLPYHELREQLPAYDHCLFHDGERRHWLCMDCRKPCDVTVRTTREWRGYYGSAQAFENVTEAWTECCGAEFCLPNGDDGELE